LSITLPEPETRGQGHGILLGEPVLTLYLDYTYVTPGQMGRILAAVGGVFDAIQMAAYDSMLQSIRLVVVEAHTSHSWEYKFGGWFPRVRFKDGNMEIWTPKWLAITVLGGSALIFIDQASGAAESLEKKVRPSITATWDHIHNTVDTDRLFNPDEPSGEKFRYELAVFRDLIDTPNIRQVKVNGIEVRRRRDEEENPRPPRT